MAIVKIAAFAFGGLSVAVFLSFIAIDAAAPETGAGRFSRMILEFSLWPGGITGRFGIYVGIGWKLAVAAFLVRKSLFSRWQKLFVSE